MKKYLLVFVSALIALLLLASCGAQNKDGNVNTEQGGLSFSSFSAVDFDGNPVNQSVFAEKKLTMINIWATFCGPCIREMPDLAKLNTAYGDDFQIIGIPIDVVDQHLNERSDKMQAARDIIATTNADYPHLVPSGSLFELHLNEVQAVPETIFVDSNGNQVGDIYLGSKTENEWATIIEALLERVQ